MAKGECGTTGIGDTGETKYGAENAPVIKNGGNEARMQGIVTEASPESLIKSGSNKK